MARTDGRYTTCFIKLYDDGRLAVAEMTDTEPLPGRVDRLEHKLDDLSRSVDKLSASVDGRFEDVNKRFDAVDKRFDAVDKRFDHVDKRLDHVDKRLDHVDKRLDDVDKRFEEVSEHFVEQRKYTEFAFDKLRGEMQAGFRRIEGRLDRFENKFDEFVASQARPVRPQRLRRTPKKR
jgi:predicted  nucleic acid-binding Zn-ribbon protein